MSAACGACARLEAFREDPRFIHEFAGSVLFAGDHAYFPGYCVLFLKAHAREWHELDGDAVARMALELRQATAALQRAYAPWKLNHACLGNQVQHVHWHIMPRYESDADRLQHPWLHHDQFAGRPLEGAALKETVERIRRQL